MVLLYTVEYWIPPQRNSAAGIYSAFVEVIFGDPPQFYFDIFWFWGFPSEKDVGLSKRKAAENQGVMGLGFRSTIGLFQEWNTSNNHIKLALYPMNSPPLLVQPGIKSFPWGHTLLQTK